MDGVNSQRGFTVIEVSLFLGITALLFLVALLGTGNTIRAARFTDSGRSLTAYLQQQYDDIINGLDTRTGQESCTSGVISTGTAQTPGTSNCLLIGKLLVFQTGSANITQYNVIGSEPASVDYSQSDTALISAFRPQVVTATGVSTYSIPWGAFLLGSKRLSDNQAVTALLLVRSPKSSRILSYTYKPANPLATDLTSVVNDASNVGQTANFCIMNADNFGLPAKIVISSAPTQSAVEVIFDANSGGTDCNGI